jgi:Rrf2 family protein
MISQSAEYSLRAVVCLAMAEQKPLTTQQIAQVSHVPAGYLAKVINALRRAGIVSSQRGAGGGHLLGRRPQDLTLLEVIQVADDSHRISICPLGIGSHGTQLCTLHRKLDQAVQAAEQTLGQTTIADVLNDPSFHPLCEHKPVSLEVAHASHG